MLLLDGPLAFSATDLSGYLACGHLPTLDRQAALGALDRPPAVQSLAARYGDQHELAYLAGLRARGLRVAELARPRSFTRAGLAEAQAQTVAALADGYDVVYQGTFFDGTWLGHPDFLVRRAAGGGAEAAGRDAPPVAVGSWAHAYDVVDTKLARRAKATALLQVALYGRLLAPLQGVEPRELILALGDGSEERFPYAGVAAYLNAVMARFTEALAMPASTPYPYPYPVEHCDLCAWDPHCRERRRRDDHLSQVAGIRRQQVDRLEGAGVSTMSALAAMGDGTALATPGVGGQPAVRIGRSTLRQLRQQAGEQVRTRDGGALTFSLLPAVAGHGLDLLPAPDPGDVFFDMEGFPYAVDAGAEDGGLEYLFGWVDTAGTFHHRFAEDRAGERRAFEQFMDDLAERRRSRPGMHVYHYASYERSALSHLSNRHGVREEEVADLLREGVLVDLYQVVRGAVVVGAESYSIKSLEPLYGLYRTGEVQTAAESLDMYQEWLDSVPRDQAILDRIAAYNEVDCRSTRQLRDWLLGLGGPAPSGTPTAPATPTPRAPSDRFVGWLAQAETAAAALLADVPEDPADRDGEQQGRHLLAHLLKFHQREGNAGWREFFGRLELSVDELRDDDGVAVGDLRFEGPGDRVRQSRDYVYSFPAQDVGLRLGDRPIDPATGRSPGELVRVEAVSREDPGRGVLVLRRGVAAEAPDPEALVPQGVVDDYVLRHALLRLADWVVAHGLTSPRPEWRAARQLLLRRPPRFTGSDEPGTRSPRTPLARAGEHGSEALVRIAPDLDGAALPVQGPPGSGKTYSAAQVIVDAVGRGRRVGVTANSHRVIEHLLAAVVAEGARRDQVLRVVHRTDAGDRQVAGVTEVADNKGVVALLDGDQVDVLGATAWLMARPEMAGRLDLLVVDEAGQVSLANALASASAATDILLVGDPAQLDQPMQAAHPAGTDVSALAHLIGQAATMPDELGLFLDRTRRLHPSICRFVSEMVYDGKLSSVPGLEHQAVIPGAAGSGLAGSGLRWLPVAHEGNRTSSIEEADRVAAAVGDLLGGRWVDAAEVERPLGPGDLLVVTPYNAQIAALRARLPEGVEAGTVDRFQGREAPVVFYSMATSTVDDLPRDFEFLFSLNRLNVAVSRARALAVLVCSPALRAPRCRTTRQVRLANALCRFIESAGPSTSI